MCFDKIFQAIFGGGGGGGFVKEEQQVNTPPPPAPTAPPAPSAAPPEPDPKKSGELERASADRTGFGALIIPRTSLAPVSKNVPTG